MVPVKKLTVVIPSAPARNDVLRDEVQRVWEIKCKVGWNRAAISEFYPATVEPVAIERLQIVPK